MYLFSLFWRKESIYLRIFDERGFLYLSWHHSDSISNNKFCSLLFSRFSLSLFLLLAKFWSYSSFFLFFEKIILFTKKLFIYLDYVVSLDWKHFKRIGRSQGRRISYSRYDYSRIQFLFHCSEFAESRQGLIISFNFFCLSFYHSLLFLVFLFQRRNFIPPLLSYSFFCSVLVEIEEDDALAQAHELSLDATVQSQLGDESVDFSRSTGVPVLNASTPLQIYDSQG